MATNARNLRRMRREGSAPDLQKYETRRCAGDDDERRRSQVPEPVPFCRRCFHDFECMPDGKCSRCRGSYRLLCPGCSREFRGTDEGRAKYNRHRCEQRALLEPRERRKRRPMSSESLITTENALFTASEDEGSHLPSTPGYSPSGATLPKRLSDGALDAARYAAEVAMDVAKETASTLQDPFAETLTEPEGAKPEPREVQYVSEADLIGGAIASRNPIFDAEKYGGVGGKSKTPQPGTKLGATVDGVMFELPGAPDAKQQPKACAMRYSLYIMLIALVLALVGIGIIVTVGVRWFSTGAADADGAAEPTTSAEGSSGSGARHMLMDDGTAAVARQVSAAALHTARRLLRHH